MDIGRSADDIFLSYSKVRSEFIGRLVSTPEELFANWAEGRPPFPVDSSCLFPQGNRSQERRPFRMHLRRYQCSSCADVGRLTSPLDTPTKASFAIEYGEHVGRTFELRTTEYTRSRVIREPGNVSLDSFSASVFMAWYAFALFEQRGLPHIVDVPAAFLCQKTGTLMVEKFALANYSQYARENHVGPMARAAFDESVDVAIVRGLFAQIAVIALTLREDDVLHGDISPDSFLVAPVPCNYAFRGRTIACPLTIKLDRWGKGGANIHTNNGVLAVRSYSPLLPYLAFVKRRTTPRIVRTYLDHGAEPVERIEWARNATTVEEARCHWCCDGHVSSLVQEVYVMVMLLLAERTIEITVRRDPALARLWRVLWAPGEDGRANATLAQARSLTGSEKIRKIFAFTTSTSLRCDVANILWDGTV